jgi:LacI family transcriptional regulator
MTSHEPWSIYVDQRGLNDPPPAWLKDWNGHGVIMRAQTSRMAQVVADLKVPAVDTQHQLKCLNVPSVISDHTAIARFAVDHLLDRHFRHFAFVGVERALWSRMRRDAFADNLQRAGYHCHVYSPISRRRFLESWEGGQQDLAEWLSELPKPVGVFAAHDLRGLCVLDACRRNGLLVPEQVAVVGVDNDETLCNLADPPLSSVKLDLERMGYQAAAVLDQLMRGRKAPKKPTAIKPLGVVTRRSTDVVAIGDPLTAQAIRYIHQHSCNGITVDDIAKHCRVSRSFIERSFSKYLGTPPHEHIVRAKMSRAKQLLTETDYPLSAIAAKIGLSQAAYFSVLFKKEVGQTPGEFRKTAMVIAE